MFKSTFSKYLLAFTIIILLSFLMLASIFTAIVGTYVKDSKKAELVCAVETVAEQMENSPDSSFIPFYIELVLPTLNAEYDIEILITDADGNILLSTLVTDENGRPEMGESLGTLNVSDFSSVKDSSLLFFEGRIDGEDALAYAHPFTTKSGQSGYVFSFVSDNEDGSLVGTVRKTVINASIWVIFAAIIATYFITDRITHPLKMMTRASKNFAKGDFSERVKVDGKDEVAQLATAFNQMADSLESLESMRNSFLANVSHDLRTPMTTISGFIDGITSGAIPPEEQNHYLGIISAEVHRLSRLVSELLDISRLESGDRKFELADFDITEVARLIIISFEQKLEEKKLDVEFISDDDVMIANADKDAIYQVLYNLCHNAIKFSRENGRFFIRIKNIPGKKISVSVYDDGQVLTAEDAAKIFDRFYKTDKSRGLDKNGVGLGLYICKTIIDAHGEKIYVEPHAEGCEFTFTLKAGTQAPRLKSGE
ncbi:MAG: HAMP domain-containing histidine kinase [Clostridia bacterium]|nr:HAMP domain-containing histidine kinase [Clostridia bacterium]